MILLDLCESLLELRLETSVHGVPIIFIRDWTYECHIRFIADSTVIYTKNSTYHQENLTFHHPVVKWTILFCLKSFHSPWFATVPSEWLQFCDTPMSPTHFNENYHLFQNDYWNYIHFSVFVYWTYQNLFYLDSFSTGSFTRQDKHGNDIVLVFERKSEIETKDPEPSQESLVFSHNLNFDAYHICFRSDERNFEFHVVGNLLKMMSEPLSKGRRKVHSGNFSSTSWFKILKFLRKQKQDMIVEQASKYIPKDCVQYLLIHYIMQV